MNLICWLDQVVDDLETLSNTLTLTPNALLSDLKDTIDSKQKVFTTRKTDLEKKRSKIVIIGRAGTGKTTLVNTLLGEKILPEGILATTAMNTLIEYGTSDTAVLIDEDGSRTELELKKFTKDYRLDSSGNLPKGFVDESTYASIQHETPFLQEGIELVDTPSLGYSERFDRVASKLCGQAQALIYLLDATQPFNNFDINFLKNLSKHLSITKVFFVVNKLDLLKTEDEIEDVRNFVNQLLAQYIEKLNTSEINLQRMYMISARQNKLPTHQNIGFQNLLTNLESVANVLDNEFSLRIALNDIYHHINVIFEKLEQAKSIFPNFSNHRGPLYNKISSIEKNLVLHKENLQEFLEKSAPPKSNLQPDVEKTVLINTTPQLKQRSEISNSNRAQIFLSYRRSDSSGHTGRIYDRLLQSFTKDQIFVDVGTINPGDSFEVVIHSALEKCRILLAVIGPSWATVVGKTGRRRLEEENDWVRYEILKALELGILIIPILVNGAKPLSKNDLPVELVKLTSFHVAMIRDEYFHDDMTRIVKLLENRLNTKIL